MKPHGHSIGRDGASADGALPFIAVPIPKAVELSGLSRSGIYRAIQAGTIKIKKSGSRTLVLYRSLVDHVEGLPDGERRAA